MPVHDWSRVDAGVFHDFHLAWVVEIANALNTGLLPPDYYAMIEQHRGSADPDGITLPVQTDDYVRKRRTVAIRHSRDDRIVALVEVVCPATKKERHAFQSFVEKVVASLARGYQLLVIDLHSHCQHTGKDIHSEIWEKISGDQASLQSDKPLMLTAYTAGAEKRAYVEAMAVGDSLPDMPLFLDPGCCLSVPLEQTYQAAYRGLPDRWRKALESRLDELG
jgi:hypothetical protein